MDKKRILIVSFPSGIGGTEKFVMNLCEAIDNDKYVFDLLYYHGINQFCKDFFERKESLFYEMPDFTKSPVKFLVEIIQFYKKHPEYKIIYHQANSASSILYSFPVWFKKDVKILFHSHNSYSAKMYFHMLCSKIVNWRCDYKFSCSEIAGKFMYGNSADKYEIINNGINLNNYKYNDDVRKKMREKYRIGDAIVIGHVGGLRKQKNQGFLIDIFKSFLNYYPNAILMIVGDGELREEIENKIEKTGLKDRVLLIGNVKNVEDYYQVFDVFLLPSLYEGLPFVGIEAQASGTFCVFSENVDHAVAVTPLAHFYSVNQKPEEWASYLSTQIDSFIKQDYIYEIEKSGYGLKKLGDYYNKVFDKIGNDESR